MHARGRFCASEHNNMPSGNEALEARRAKVKSCAFTNKRAGWGREHRAGECALTQYARDGVVPDDQSNLVSTYCNGCHKTMCVSCLSCIAGKLDEIDASRRSVVSDSTNSIPTSARASRRLDYFIAMVNLFSAMCLCVW